jgi:hypothetical protein
MKFKQLSLVAATCLATSSVALADAGLDNTFGAFLNYHSYNEQAMAISKLCQITNSVTAAIADEFYYGYDVSRENTTLLTTAAVSNSLWPATTTDVSDELGGTTQVVVADGGAGTATITLTYVLEDGDDGAFSVIVATVTPGITPTDEDHNYSRIEALDIGVVYQEDASALNLPDALASLLTNDCQIGRLSDN